MARRYEGRRLRLQLRRFGCGKPVIETVVLDTDPTGLRRVVRDVLELVVRNRNLQQRERDQAHACEYPRSCPEANQ